MDFPKTYRANAGWALSIGAFLALLSQVKGTIGHEAVIGLVIVGCIGAAWSAWEHGWLRRPRHKGISALFVIWGLMLFLGFEAWSPSPEPNITASLGIDSVDANYINFHVEVENNGASAYNLLRAFKTPDASDQESIAPHGPRTLQHSGKETFIPPPFFLKSSDYNSVDLLLSYRDQPNSKETVWLYRFFFARIQAKPGEVIWPDVVVQQ